MTFRCCFWCFSEAAQSWKRDLAELSLMKAGWPSFSVKSDPWWICFLLLLLWYLWASLTDADLLIVSLACFCFSYPCHLLWGRKDTETVAQKFYLLLKICKLLFGSCQKLGVLYGWCKYLAVLQLIAICINMEGSFVVYALIYVNIWKFM